MLGRDVILYAVKKQRIDNKIGERGGGGATLVWTKVYKSQAQTHRWSAQRGETEISSS